MRFKKKPLPYEKERKFTSGHLIFFFISFPFDYVLKTKKLKTLFWNKKDPKYTLYIHISLIWAIGLKMFHS